MDLLIEGNNKLIGLATVGVHVQQAVIIFRTCKDRVIDIEEEGEVGQGDASVVHLL